MIEFMLFGCHTSRSYSTEVWHMRYSILYKHGDTVGLYASYTTTELPIYVTQDLLSYKVTVV